MSFTDYYSNQDDVFNYLYVQWIMHVNRNNSIACNNHAFVINWNSYYLKKIAFLEFMYEFYNSALKLTVFLSKHKSNLIIGVSIKKHNKYFVNVLKEFCFVFIIFLFMDDTNVENFYRFF